ncbi:MAG: DUF898 family protein [Pseudomonadales bacterium]|nr:DUF898 family protein [Pseudomonadales bacterium]MCP5214578.1 DUF898 family protein [Pseudomonadales bacterium]
MWVVNLLLTIVPLGIYSAWAKVLSKKHLYGNTVLNGSVFDYTARPTQILKWQNMHCCNSIRWSILQRKTPCWAESCCLKSDRLNTGMRFKIQFDRRACRL